MKLSHARGGTRDGQVMMERSDRMWSSVEGNGKPLQYSCLENPMNNKKRQNDRILKEKLPRSVGAQYATGDQWRNNSRKNEGMEPKQKEYTAVDVTGDRSKVRCCKEQYCMTNLASILKRRDITLLTKVRLVKAIVFPVVMNGCESCPVKKAEYRRIDAFELWCWRRVLSVPWTSRRSNQSILKEISPGCSLEGMMLKLKLQYFGHLMQRADSFEKILMLGKIEGRRRRGRQRMYGWMASLTQWT